MELFKIKAYNTTNYSSYFYQIFIIVILSYLFLGVGLHGDDYHAIMRMNDFGLWEFLNPDPNKQMDMQVLGLPNFYTIWWAYPVLGYEFQWLYDVIKIIVHAISIYLIYTFAKDYFSPDRALLFSLIFVLYPLHDAANYWYMALYYITIPAIILFAHSLIRKNRIKTGLLLLFLGTAWQYGSPPYVFGMAMVFIFENKIKKALIFSIPGFVYIFFYFWVKYSYSDVERRIDPDLDTVGFIKNFTLQFMSFIESAIGPSYWLKIYYSISSISFISIIIVLIITTYLFKVSKLSLVTKINKSLLFGLISIVLLSFAMFSLTGLYVHSAFNLGNRSTIYGSLLIAFLLAAFLPAKKKYFVLLLLIFIAPVFGLSDYWKSWNTHQKIIIENIQENQALKATEENSTIIVTGNLYSNLGPFSHIEFFSMPWNLNAIFKNHAKSRKFAPLTPNISYENDLLVDDKFGNIYSLKNKIYVYDSIKNSVKEINKSNIDDLIQQQPKVVRHWTQLLKDTWIQKFIVLLSPRLNYLFK